MNQRSRSLVLFSGGQDSTTCLAWALDRYDHVETVGFDYGQRHAIEMKARESVLRRLRASFPEWASKLGDDHVLSIPVLGEISDTALTRESEMTLGASGLPNTFAPGRNLLLFVLASALAYRRGLKAIVGGMCETDFSGYPDCRDDAIKAQQVAVNLGMDSRFAFETPLMWIDKAATWAMADRLGGAALVDLIVEETHTCYLGDRSVRHPWGYGCGTCPACELRKGGFERWRQASP
jgi:7-cyano-7-deazaguanine synthase